MITNLLEVKKVLSLIFKKTDELRDLNEKVDEIVIDDLVKDFTLHRFKKENTNTSLIYDVKKDDYEHILEYLHLIQVVIPENMTIMAQTDKVDSFRIIFRKG